MDPKACLNRMIDALDNGDIEEADYAGRDLHEWIRKGGFFPEDLNAAFGEALARLNDALHADIED